MRRLICVFVLLCGCFPPTYFTGQARVPKGPQGCQEACQQMGMELPGMVTMGASYTDGCICSVPGKPAPNAAAAAAAAAASGVMTQTEQSKRRDGPMGTPTPS